MHDAARALFFCHRIDRQQCLAPLYLRIRRQRRAVTVTAFVSVTYRNGRLFALRT